MFASVGMRVCKCHQTEGTHLKAALLLKSLQRFTDKCIECIIVQLSSFLFNIKCAMFFYFWNPTVALY